MHTLNQAIAARVLRFDMPAVPNWVPPSLAATVTACWARVPHDRPTFTEIAERLNTCLGDLIPQRVEQAVVADGSSAVVASPVRV